jgi:hypothetical protein
LVRKAEPSSIQVIPQSFNLQACKTLDVLVVGRFMDTPPGKLEDLTNYFKLVVNGPARQTAPGKITADCFTGTSPLDIYYNAVPLVPGLYDPGGGGGGQQTGDVSGKIYKPVTYQGAASAPVWIDMGGGNLRFGQADANGIYFIADVLAGSGYYVNSSLQGYTRNTKTINVLSGQNTSASIVLGSGANFDGDANVDSVDTDDDNDGVPDSQESTQGSSPFNKDSDGDGYADNVDAFPNNASEWLDTDGDLTGDNADTDDDNDGILDTEEVIPGSDGYITDPKLWDTDAGSEGDGSEVTNGRNPTNPSDDQDPTDSDSDGLPNTFETLHGTSVNNPDSDGDGLCDGDTAVGMTCDSGEDLDKDGVVDAGETDPTDPDSDDDRLDDGLEAQMCSSGRNYDSDGDELCDGDTAVYDGATLLCAAGEDMDLDGTVDATETDPCDWDTDNDTIADGYEKAHGLDPLVNDAAGDLDQDGLNNLAEYGHETEADNWDTDGDGLPDGFEAEHGDTLSPLNAADGDTDSDGDGNVNKHEYYNLEANVFAVDTVPDPEVEPGCYYWGKADNTGVVGPTDLATLKSIVAGATIDLEDVLPPVFDVMDLDKDGIPGPVDISYLKMMIAGGHVPSGYPSTPVELRVLEEPGSTIIAMGDTTRVIVSVRNRDQETANVPCSPGFAVVFWVSSGSATLLGGDGSDDNEAEGNRFDISGLDEDEAPASIVVRVDASGPITVQAKIPACGTEPAGRWMDAVTLTNPIIINGE